MATTHKNRVQMTVTGTPGTGTITLNAASSGYQTFGSAHGANATVDCLFTDGTAWEVARDCTYTHSGTTLSRGTLEASSTGSAISLTSAAVVSQIATADVGNRLERAMQAVTPGGRLTLESGVPVSTTDQTAKTTIYYTPYIHDTITLWDGARWVPVTFAETSEALGTLTSGLPYDVFGFLSSGVLDLEKLAWTNGTTRATAVTLQDGRYCKSGDKTRLLLGTFYTTTTTTTEDSLTNRYVSNVYNTLRRTMSYAITGTYTHTYTTTSWREWNAGTGVTRLQFVCSIPIGSIGTNCIANFTGGAAIHGYINVGIDATDGTSKATGTNIGGYGSNIVPSNSADVAVGVGKHYLTIIEYGNSGTTYFSADILANLLC